MPATSCIGELSGPPTSGFSNETIITDAVLDRRQRRADQSKDWSFRVKPTGYQVFLESDFEQQIQVLRVLDAETDVPVPPMLWVEDDPAVLGAPFFVMRKVPGRPASDQPPYNESGWLAEATPADREAMWRSAVEALVTVHRVPLEKVAFLAKPELGPTGFDQIFEYWRRSFEWAARRRVRTRSPRRRWSGWSATCRPSGRRRCRGATPASATSCSTTTGPRPSSTGRCSPSAGTRWTSPGGCSSTRFHSFGVPRLEGLGSRADTIAIWEEGTGERADALEWYEVFAGFRFAIVLMRIGQMYVSFGVPRDDLNDMERNNPVTHLLARMLDLEPPGPLPWS